MTSPGAEPILPAEEVDVDMMVRTRAVACNMGLGVLGVMAVLGCASSSQEAAAPPSAEASAPPPQDPAEESAAPSKQKLAEAVAAQVAATWDTEKAAKEQVELTLRLRVEAMSAVVVGKGDGAYTLTGIDAVNTKPDVVVDLSREDAAALAEGETGLRQLKEAGKVQTDNDQGLDLFLSYTK